MKLQITTYPMLVALAALALPLANANAQMEQLIPGQYTGGFVYIPGAIAVAPAPVPVASDDFIVIPPPPPMIEPAPRAPTACDGVYEKIKAGTVDVGTEREFQASMIGARGKKIGALILREPLPATPTSYPLLFTGLAHSPVNPMTADIVELEKGRCTMVVNTINYDLSIGKDGQMRIGVAQKQKPFRIPASLISDGHDSKTVAVQTTGASSKAALAAPRVVGAH